MAQDDRVYFPVRHFSPPDSSIQSQRYYRRLGKRQHYCVRQCEFRHSGDDNLGMEVVRWGLDRFCY